MGLWLATATLASAALPPELPPEQLDWQTRPGAEAGQLCSGYYLAPALDLPEAHLSPEAARLFADSQDLSYSQEGGLNLSGGVRLRKGPLYLLSDQAWINAERTRARLSGNLQVREEGLLLRAREGEYRLDDEYFSAREAYYLLHDQHLRGSAWQLQQLPDGRVRLKDASMTTCAPQDAAWQLVAGRIDLNRDSGFGDAYHVRLEVRDLPIFYWPWLRFPIDGKRHTGLLPPSFSVSTSDEVVDFTQPFYWNLAPNYDATFYPRHISDRGQMLGTELRYLQARDRGEIFYAYLPGDERYYDLDRWHLSTNHQGRFASLPLSYTWDFSQVSDHRYFLELGQGAFGESDSDQLLQKLQLDTDLGRGWQGQLQWMGYQKLLPSQDPNSSLATAEETFALFDIEQGRQASNQDYYRFPQLQLSGRENWGRYLNTSLLVDLTQFDKLFDPEVSGSSQYAPSPTLIPGSSDDYYLRSWGATQALRLHLDAGLAADFSWPWAYLRPGVHLKHNRYQLDPYWNPAQDLADADKREAVNLEPQVTLPVYTLDTGLFLEREARILGEDWLQTLEPRLFAAYIPYEEQYEIPPIFDGGFSEFNINQLYQAERSTGRDRVGDQQKVTLGVTQRLLSPSSGREIASLGIAREFYFADRRLSQQTLHPEDPGRLENLAADQRPYSQVREQSNLAVQLNWSLTSNLQVRSSLLWDDHFEKTDRSNFSLSYQDPLGTHLNLGYSYTSNYLDINPLGKDPDPSLIENYSYLDSAEEQAYVSGVLPLRNHQLRMFFKQSWDWKRDESLDSLLGIEYSSCCWQLQLMYRDWVKNPDVSPAYQPASYTDGFAERERDAGIFFQVIFRGLGGAGQGVDDVLTEELQGYSPRNYTNER
ncbi:LPS-assembly protein LptD [Marinospirillum perlucidum]|uniref:LPS-assembly protein LptD n=1 Tax=Marinospirillum perlucidum TaxID=1982602 RepID=UPI000DF44685|nr:LPS assembly protein LptD [Marinospirillum perlucidum]